MLNGKLKFTSAEQRTEERKQHDWRLRVVVMDPRDGGSAISPLVRDFSPVS